MRALTTLLLLGLLTACQSDVVVEKPAPSPSPTSVVVSTPTATTPPTASATPSTTPTPTPEPTFTPIPTATSTSTATPTPDPYAGLTVADLSQRRYGGGELNIEEVLAVTDSFTRSLVSYPSDGLSLYGFMNTPRGDGPFPVALVMHGYVPPEQYNTLAYTTRYADGLARAGYLVLHPNYRNYPPSAEGDDRFRVSHAVDALNLISIIKEQAGKPGPLAQADPDFVGMVGHSMGGGITLRTVTISDAVQAAVLYGSMSGDEQRNFQKILEWSGGARGQEELDTPAEDLQRISPIFHLERLSAAVSIHHGDNDGTVPLAWSEALCQQLQGLNKTVECFTYPGQPHTFQGEADQLFIQRVVDFFDRVRAENGN